MWVIWCLFVILVSSSGVYGIVRRVRADREERLDRVETLLGGDPPRRGTQERIILNPVRILTIAWRTFQAQRRLHGFWSWSGRGDDA